MKKPAPWSEGRVNDFGSTHIGGGWQPGFMVWGLDQPNCQPLEAMVEP